MRTAACVLRGVLGLSVWLAGAAGVWGAGSESPEPLPSEVTAFAAAKEEHARDLAKELDLTVSPEIWAYFKTARAGEWDRISEQWEKLGKLTGRGKETNEIDPTVRSAVYQTVIEVQLMAEQYALGEPKYATALGRDIIKSIPAGSIYLGGTDPGRGLVTGLCRSHRRGDPFFVLTQNALADGEYLVYVRTTYGDRIRVLSEQDSQKGFQDYLADAQRRLDHDRNFPDGPRQIKPGEDVRVVDNRVQVSGQVAVMSINARLVRMIFDRNPEREFFVEESFPLDWMYPHLAPHGLILKLHREPLQALSVQQVRQDREFWSGQVRVLLGDWLREETSVGEVCRFAERVFVGKDLAGFKGDPLFVKNAYASRNYSKLRSSVAGLYAWRLNNTHDSEERTRMLQAADLAFRQAYALCPSSPEALYRYVNLLVQQSRFGDALALARVSARLMDGKGQVENLITQLERMQKQVEKKER